MARSLTLQHVTLEPLPEGVTEELPIQCNGRSALLAIRTQRVLFNDQEISASKFEALCGKGDAKKWKCSIWFEDDEGEPAMVRCGCQHLKCCMQLAPISPLV